MWAECGKSYYRLVEMTNISLVTGCGEGSVGQDDKMRG